MNTPSTSDLQAGRLLLLKNAMDLKEEAELLLEHQKWARAYLLAHLASEELAKTALFARAERALENGERFSWPRLRDLMRLHPMKLKVMVLADHVDSVDIEPGDEDISLDAKLGRVDDLNWSKNASMYVDLAPPHYVAPWTAVTETNARGIVGALRGRWLWAYPREVLFPGKLEHAVLDTPEFEAFWRSEVADAINEGS